MKENNQHSLKETGKFHKMFCKFKVICSTLHIFSLYSDTIRKQCVMKVINYRKIYTCHLKNMLLASKCKKTVIKIGCYFIILSIAILIALIPNIVSRNDNKAGNKSERFKTDLKYILFWKQPKRNKKNFYNKDVEYIPGQTQFIKQNCPYINCYISYNTSLLGSEVNYDAVVFNIHDVRKVSARRLHLERNINQIYIFKSQESSQHHPLCHDIFDGFFNWTWTYKLNSDIPHPFINIHNVKNDLIGPKDKIEWVTDMKHTEKYKSKIDGKKKAVAWLVTNCKLKHKHQEFVNDLREELKGYNHTVDTFGPCSENKCPKGGVVKCFKMIEKDYFFNLVLEETFAEDFITEKMAKAMSYFSIPIVGGTTNYTRFLPPGSYINFQEFDMKKLGSIIDYLIENPSKYSYFFDWKTYYFYTTRARDYLCDLCTKLNENNEQKSYKEMRRWWNSDYEDTCQKMHLYHLFRDTP